jgi:hypothetical protein
MNKFDLDYFVNSTFCKKGSVVLNTNKNPQFRSDRIIQFDASLPDFKKVNSLREFRNNQNSETINIWPSLYTSLTRSTLSEEMFILVSSQWQSVLNVIRQIDQEPDIGSLMIMLPDVNVVKHTHQSSIKQTLTFEFNFPEYTCDSLNESNISLYIDDRAFKLKHGSTNKTVFTILNNHEHSAYCKNLKFFWVYDFVNYIDLSKVDFGDFEFLEFVSIKDKS